MNKCKLNLTLTLFFSLFALTIYSQTTLYLTTSGGSFEFEKWVEITTLPNGGGTQIWGQGNGSYGDSPGFLTDATFSVNCGATLYINAYDKYDDSWDGSVYEIWTGPGKTGILVANNSGISPDDANDDDASPSFGDTQAEELEVSEAFSIVCPCNAPSAIFSTVADCGNSQFFIDVNLSSTGDGSAVDISDGSTPFFTNVGIGTHRTGPFPYNTNVIITVDGSSYGGCDLNSVSLTEDCVCSNTPSATINSSNLNCVNSTYDIETTIDNFGDGSSADIYIDGALVQSNALLSVLYTFSNYSTGTHTVEIRVSGSGFLTCSTSYPIASTCNGTDSWSITAPDIMGKCSSGDLSAATIDGPTDFGPFCHAAGISGFSLNFLRPCNSGFDNTTDFTDVWYQVDIPDGSDEMTLELTGLGLNEYVAYTLHTNGPLSSSDDFMVDATAEQECSFFSQAVTSHTITGLSAYSTAPIYIRILSADPNQNLACGSFLHPSFNICATSPQANDACSSAIDITTNNGGSESDGNLSDANDEGINCLAGVTGKDLWYNVSNILSSAPNYNGPYTVQFKADGQSGEQMIVQLIDGCYTCGSITVLATDTLTFASPDSTDFGAFELSGGVSDYKIRVVEKGITNSFTASAKLKVVNDECDYFNAPVTGFRLWDGSNPVVRNVDMNFASEDDLYYNFSSLLSAPVFSGTVDFTLSGLGSNESVRIEVYERSPLYSTDCDNLTLVGNSLNLSSDGTNTYKCLNEFEGDYLVRVINTGSVKAVFELSAEPSSPVPVNDRCSNIWNGSSVTFNGNAFDITGTTINSDFTDSRDCDLISSDCNGLDLTAEKDLWYHFSIPSANCPDISVSTNITDVTINYDASNAFKDAYIYVYSDCSAASLLACSGSLDGAGDNFTVSGLSPGETYLVRIKPSSLNSGNNYSFDLSASLGPVRPCNDRSENARALGSILNSGTDRSNCLNGPFSAKGATSSINPASGTDVWLSFVAPNPANGQSYQVAESYLTIYLQSLSGTGIPYFLSLRVYDEVGLNNSVGVPLGETSVGGGSSTISTNTNGDAWLSLGHLTPGETYFIRISHNQPVDEEVLYNLCMYDTETQDPCAQSSLNISQGVECSDDCSKYFRIQLPDNAPSGFFRFEAIGNNGVDVNMRMFFQPNETLGTNTGDITDVDQPCGIQSLVSKVGQGTLTDPGTCNGGSGNFGIFNLIGGASPTANMYYLEVYDENNLLGCGGLDICQINVNGPFSTLALAQANGIPDADCINSLPVELLSFSGYSDGNNNVIEWETATEINHEYFELQRSENGSDFETIVRINADGDSYTTKKYLEKDYSFYSISYYRLYQQDLGGKGVFSKVISISNKRSEEILISPVPSKDYLYIYGIQEEVDQISIINSIGQGFLVQYKTEPEKTSIDLKGFADGIYTLLIKYNDEVISRKLIIRQ